jgi:hypothetical protein
MMIIGGVIAFIIIIILVSLYFTGFFKSKSPAPAPAPAPAPVSDNLNNLTALVKSTFSTCPADWSYIATYADSIGIKAVPISQDCPVGTTIGRGLAPSSEFKSCEPPNLPVPPSDLTARMIPCMMSSMQKSFNTGNMVQMNTGNMVPMPAGNMVPTGPGYYDARNSGNMVPMPAVNMSLKNDGVMGYGQGYYNQMNAGNNPGYYVMDTGNMDQAMMKDQAITGMKIGQGDFKQMNEERIKIAVGDPRKEEEKRAMMKDTGMKIGQQMNEAGMKMAM